MAQSKLQSLLPDLSASLKAFQTSSSRYRVVHTINPFSSLTTAPIRTPSPCSAKTLLILDSSFNPPSMAHFHLASSALDDLANRQPNGESDPSPARLILLFSTNNADKSPCAASFAHRLALMTLFAHDLSTHHHGHRLRTAAQKTGPVSLPGSAPVSVDIALTTRAYYTDKSDAITKEGNYNVEARHVHIMGFDTLTRFLGSKYYKDHDPPLSALRPFFDAGHGLRVTLRPSEVDGAVDSQREWIAGLRDGRMDGDGAQRWWADRIQCVEADRRTESVSSTRIREAAAAGDEQEVHRLCSPAVASAVLEEPIYE